MSIVVDLENLIDYEINVKYINQIKIQLQKILEVFICNLHTIDKSCFIFLKQFIPIYKKSKNQKNYKLCVTCIR